MGSQILVFYDRVGVSCGQQADLLADKHLLLAFYQISCSVLIVRTIFYQACTHWLPVTNDYDCILAMLPGSSRNGRLEVTSFLVPTTSETVSVIRRDAERNTSRLIAPGSLNTCPMCEGQRRIFNVHMILLWYTGPPSLDLDPRSPAILWLKTCWRFFVTLTQLRLDPSTAWLTVQASSNIPHKSKQSYRLCKRLFTLQLQESSSNIIHF